LTRYEYYTTLKHGFCRGGEALGLTENIRNYYDILARFEEPHMPAFSTFVAQRNNDELKNGELAQEQKLRPAAGVQKDKLKRDAGAQKTGTPKVTELAEGSTRTIK